MKTTWNELDPYSQPKPFVSVRVSSLEGDFLAEYLALLDTGSRLSYIPGTVVSQDVKKRVVTVDLQLPSGMRKRIADASYRLARSGIWLSPVQERAGIRLALEFGGHRPEPVTFYLADPPRGMEPHLILGCDFLFAGGGMCIDARRRRFRLSLCASEAATASTTTA